MAHDLTKLPEVAIKHFGLIERLITDLPDDDQILLTEIRQIVAYTFGAQLGARMIEKRNAAK